MRKGPPALLRVKDLERRYGGATALTGFTLSLSDGESLGVTGPNGCGKTTLVDIVSGFVRPDRGRVWLADREITSWPPHQIVRVGVARTFQLPRCAFRMTVEQNLEAGVLHRHLGRRGRAETVTQVLDLVGLEPLRRREVCTLSLGEIRRIELGRAVATGARVLLLDEPFAALSPSDAPAVLSALRRLRADGTSMLIVAHGFTLFQALCDRIAVLEAGRLIHTGPPADLLHA